MGFSIRRVLPEDVYEYCALHIACWRDAYTGIVPDAYIDKMSSDLEQRAESMSRTIEEPGGCEFLCAMYNGEMIGRLIFCESRDEDKPDAGDVMAIYLLAGHWGKGYGRQMMDYAVDELKRAGHEEIIVWVLEENSRGRRFYEKYGFTLDGAKKTLDIGKPLTCLRYALEL